MSDLSAIQLAKDAYLALSNGNYASLEESTDEFISIISEDEGDLDPEALKGILVATLNFLRTQRKLNKYLVDNVPAPDKDVVDYAVDVAERIGLTENVSVTLNVTPDDNVLYRELLNILYPSK